MGPRVRRFLHCNGSRGEEAAQTSGGRREFARYGLNVPGSHRESELLARTLAESDVEISQRAIAAHEHQIRHVEVGRFEKVELVLQIEI